MQRWKDEIAKRFELKDIMVFGDFSHENIAGDLHKIRSITNTVIETSNTFMRKKKDMTDFIMLDYIYQTLEQQKGIDICKALEVCQKYKIIHRDIKPSNIFVSDTRDFKLGDFGVARTLEKTSSGLSKKGTYTYMAPEVYKGQSYGSNVDIYSLGIVMYKLLNNNLDPFRKDRTYNDGETWIMKPYLLYIVHSHRQKVNPSAVT